MRPYTVEIEIELPRDKVIELFNSSENLFKWQTGLQSFEHVSGEPGQDGAKSKLVYINGKHHIELIETVTENECARLQNAEIIWHISEYRWLCCIPKNENEYETCMPITDMEPLPKTSLKPFPPKSTKTIKKTPQKP